MIDDTVVYTAVFFSVAVVFDVYRDSQVSTLMNFECRSKKMLLQTELHCILCVAGEGVADRPEPVRRGDRLAAVQLGGADVWRNHPAAGQPS